MQQVCTVLIDCTVHVGVHTMADMTRLASVYKKVDVFIEGTWMNFFQIFKVIPDIQTVHGEGEGVGDGRVYLT